MIPAMLDQLRALHQKLRRRAFAENRSLTATARLLIEQGLKRPRAEAAT